MKNSIRDGSITFEDLWQANTNHEIQPHAAFLENQVTTLTDILCAAEGARGVQDRIVINRTVQKLQDLGELTPLVVA